MIDVKDIDAIIGADVMDTANDRIGRVSQVYIDSEDQHPSWVSVRTGFFGRSETLIPIDDARWESSTLFVQVDRAKVREAPHVDPDQELSVEEQTALYRYYGKGRTEDVAGDAPAEPESAAADPEVEAFGAASADDGSAVAESADQQVEQEPGADQPVDGPFATEEPISVDDTARRTDEPTLAEAAGAASVDADEQAPAAEAASTDAGAELPIAEATDADAGVDDATAAENAGAEQSGAEETREAEQVADAAAEPEPVAALQDAAVPDVADLDAAPDEAAAPGADDAPPRHRSNFVQPDESAVAPATPDEQPEVITRYEERLRIATERVPAARMRLVKRIVTEHRTVAVPVSHEELHLEREPIGEDEIANWAGPVSELQEEEREIILMAERPVVSTHTAPIERIRLVREVVSGTHDVEADLRHEQFDLDRGEDGAAG